MTLAIGRRMIRAAATRNRACEQGRRAELYISDVYQTCTNCAPIYSLLEWALLAALCHAINVGIVNTYKQSLASTHPEDEPLSLIGC
jgi:hypothetical protein